MLIVPSLAPKEINCTGQQAVQLLKTYSKPRVESSHKGIYLDRKKLMSFYTKAIYARRHGFSGFYAGMENSWKPAVKVQMFNEIFYKYGVTTNTGDARELDKLVEDLKATRGIDNIDPTDLLKYEDIVEIHRAIAILSNVHTLWEAAYDKEGYYLGNDGQLLLPLHACDYNVLTTQRLQTNNPNLTGINRDLQVTIVPPAGYVHLYQDSSQVDPRIMISYITKDEVHKKLVNLYNDAYWGTYHFISMKSPDDFEKREADNELRQGIKRLVNKANYGGYDYSGLGLPQEIIDGFMNKVTGSPKRMEFLEQHRDQHIVKTAFGTELNIDEHKRGADLERALISYAIQGTAADLTRLSIRKTCEILDNCPEAYIAYWAHDASNIYVPEDREDIIKALDGTCGYQVMDWLPIESEMEVRR